MAGQDDNEDPSRTGTGKISFEKSLKELERIVAELEKGDTPLETQLKTFEKGVALSRECMKTLENTEKSIEKLIMQDNGKLATTPFLADP